MGTTFTPVYRYIRGLLLDSDPSVQMYSDSVLSVQVSLAIAELDDPNVVETDAGGEFTTDITRSMQFYIAVLSAMNIIAPQDDQFAYKTAVLSVSRKDGIARLYRHLEDKKEDFQPGGRFALATDQDIAAFINDTERIIQGINDGIAAR